MGWRMFVRHGTVFAAVLFTILQAAGSLLLAAGIGRGRTCRTGPTDVARQGGLVGYSRGIIGAKENGHSPANACGNIGGRATRRRCTMGGGEQDAIRSEIAALAPAFIAIRHYLHQNPELSDHEAGTSALVAERLDAVGIDDIRVGVGGNGVIATLRGASDGP